MNLTNNLYLDYNATSPLANSVKKLLASGDFDFLNPSSTHLKGREARKVLADSKEIITSIFNLNEEYQILFHPGATVFSNIFITKICLEKKLRLLYNNADHPCISMQKDNSLISSKTYRIDKLGKIDRNQDCFKKASLLNVTWVNSETGALNFNEELISSLNNQSHIIHVDAVQSVSKLDKWWELNPLVDCYTYSGHKFGSLKGIGLSIIRKNLSNNYILGGGQQLGLWSGTDNTLGIFSLALALEEAFNNRSNILKIEKQRNKFEEFIKGLQKKSIKIVGSKLNRSSNTTLLSFENSKSEILQAAYDLEGIQVGRGTACSSGTSKPSSTLLEMGFSENSSKNVLRYSFGRELDKNEFISLCDASGRVFKSID